MRVALFRRLLVTANFTPTDCHVLRTRTSPGISIESGSANMDRISRRYHSAVSACFHRYGVDRARDRGVQRGVGVKSIGTQMVMLSLNGSGHAVLVL